jgi:adenosylcobalamin-dependent ribonucleoside-triphosphate reductase
MDAAMLGVGVGFDTLGAGCITVQGAQPVDPQAPAVAVADSREGWVGSVRHLLNAHFLGQPRPHFDLSAIRPRGAPIRGFGGKASGPDILARLHDDVDHIMRREAGKSLSVTTIVDLMNLIGRCIVSGEVRQTAEIAFGSPFDEEYIALKDYARNPERAAWGWTSNNSVIAPVGIDYRRIAEKIRLNGEPGIAWLENMRAYSRMGDAPDWKDARAGGGNPCLEQTLESHELCCLVETFPARHESLDEFLATLNVAFLYAKAVTLCPAHWPATDAIMARNRRIGCSISGVAQFLAKHGLHELQRWTQAGYTHLQGCDAALSQWLQVPSSIKITSVKPSGTVSLLAGATPGVHHPESRFYVRRVRLGVDHEAVGPLKAAGYRVEPAGEDPERKVVVSFPVDAGEGIRTLDDVSMWEQLAMAAFLQRNWADNQVSCTVTFDPEREGPHIAHALDVYQYQLKGVSFLPRLPKGAYQQMPYEAISEDEYRRQTAALKPLDFSSITGAGDMAMESPDKFCDSETCEVGPLNEAVQLP